MCAKAAPLQEKFGPYIPTKPSMPVDGDRVTVLPVDAEAINGTVTAVNMAGLRLTTNGVDTFYPWTAIHRVTWPIKTRTKKPRKESPKT